MAGSMAQATNHSWTIDADGVECIHVDRHEELGLDNHGGPTQPRPKRAADLNTDVWEACRVGDLESVKRAVEAGADVNSIDRRNVSADDSTWLGQLFLAASGSTAGQSPLYLAAVSGHVEVVRFLLENGARGVDSQLFTVVNDEVREELERHGFSSHGRIDQMTEVERARFEAIQKKRREMTRTHDPQRHSTPGSNGKNKGSKQKKSWFAKRLDELYELKEKLVGKKEKNELGFAMDPS